MFLYDLNNVFSFEHTDTFPIWKQSTLHGAERRGSISSADAARISQNSKEKNQNQKFRKYDRKQSTSQNCKIAKEKIKTRNS